jgi:hypothetical protein
MTEQEWLESTQAYQVLIYIRQSASLRKLRLVAAAYARWLQSQPGYEHARPCADVIEEVADEPKSWAELEPRLWQLPGSTWELSHTLIREDVVGRAVSKMVFVAESVLAEHSESAEVVHQVMIGLVHEVFGNPFRPVSLDPIWQTSTVKSIARAIYEEYGFDRMPILADALEDAGCDDTDILNHCRSEGPHTRGCWVIDLLLDKR